MNKSIRKSILFSMILLLMVSVPSTLAYFTDAKEFEVKHSLKISIGSSITDDVVQDHIKSVTISADDDSDPIFVRVRVFAPNSVTITFDKEMNPGWEEHGDYYEYTKPLDGKASTEDIAQSVTVHIGVEFASDDEADTHNVIVIYEAVVAKYENGAWVADWNTAEGGGE